LIRDAQYAIDCGDTVLAPGFKDILKWASEHYAHVRSVVETGRRRAISAIEAIRLTLKGAPLAASP